MCRCECAADGGSHGGFLTGWLLGSEHRQLFSCGALWNPVVDLPAMLGTTDIPEWVFAEALSGGDGEPRWPLSAEQLTELYRRSPISVVDRVDVPALMVLGAADQRVPRSQGRQWVAALQQRAGAAGADVTALEYPGEGHAIATSTEASAHVLQSVVAWLVGKLREP